MIWYKYGEQDYMDMSPSYGYHLFDDDTQAKAWEKHMQENYASGRTWLCGPATQAEILEYIKGMDLDKLTLNNINNPNYYKHD